MLVDFATFHSPQDCVLYITGTNEARQHWRWAYALPHCKEADKSETLYFEVENKPGENEVDRMRLFWKNIRTILERAACSSRIGAAVRTLRFAFYSGCR